MITILNYNNIKKILFVSFAVLFAFTSISAAADLGSAKNAGFVGEKLDGYLGVVKSAPQEIQNLVNSINSKRRAKYSEIAKKNNQGLNVIERLAGQKLVNGAKPGNYYMNANGQWVKK